MKKIAQIALIIVDLQNELKAGPSSWLAKAIKKYQSPNPERFSKMEDEGWEE
jgi:nitrogen fixation protein NifX